MAKKKLRILVDLDGIVADFFKLLFREYERETGESVDVSQILSWDMAKFVQHPDTLNQIFSRQGFFTRLDPIPGAVEAVKELHAGGHEVVIVSSPCTHHSAAEKLEWCARHLPFLDQKNVWIGHKKHHVRGDVLIDDGPHNISAYRAEHPGALLLGISYPYNLDAPYDLRASGHDSPSVAWLQILDAIYDLEAATDLDG